jgi:hypothetical protein
VAAADSHMAAELPREYAHRTALRGGLTSLAELEVAAKDNHIHEPKSLGAALQTKILQNLSIAKSGQGLHLHRAASLLDHAKAALAKAQSSLSAGLRTRE